jgi:GrpB-like predicted nucleotidyltransferase (UPF0157 family)
VAALVRRVLGDAALDVEHVGSTSVAGLAAKPTKLAAAAALATEVGMVMEYNKHKEPALHQIYERMLRANGLLP